MAAHDLRVAAGHSAQLERALASSREIGMAIGILMEETGCTQDEAFRMIGEGSQRSDIKLRDLAREIVDKRR